MSQPAGPPSEADAGRGIPDSRTDAGTNSGIDTGTDPVADPPMPAPPVEQPRWRRVDPRTMLVRPFNEVIGFIPVVVGLVAFDQHEQRRFWWGLAAIALLLGRGLLHWLTTRYRITDEQVELRTGALFRQRLTTGRDRVRTVESTAKFGHRIFGVTAVRIGTGQHAGRDRKSITLDAVATAEANSLRRELLRRGAAPVTGLAAARQAEPEPTGEWLATLRRDWFRYAPLTLSGLAALGVLLGLLWRSANELNIDVTSLPPLRAGLRWVEHASTGMLISAGAVAMLLITVLGSIVVYGFRYAGFALTREPDATLHVRRGLLTRSAVTIEEARLRGVELREPLLLRLGGGARCAAVATGLRIRREGHLLMPPGPVMEAHRVAGAVLRVRNPPTTAALAKHSRAALRRRMTRAVAPPLLMAAVAWSATLPGWLPGWPWQVALAVVPVAALLGYDRYRNLGHTLAGGYLVTRFGSLDRRTVALQRSGVIGWRIRRSFFQRRAGLITLTATTAAGRGAYQVKDLVEADGLAFAEQAVPGILEPFLR